MAARLVAQQAPELIEELHLLQAVVDIIDGAADPAGLIQKAALSTPPASNFTSRM